MTDFPIWLLSIFLIMRLAMLIKAHTRLGMPVIYTMSTNTFLLAALYAWFAINASRYPHYVYDWALGLGFCSDIFWNVILMYITRKRHIA